MIQCPGCGGALKFDIASQQMKCDSCSTQYDPYQFDYGNAAEESMDYDVTVFRCPNCGGEITSTDETAAGFCSYCGSSNVLESRISKEKRPQLIIPFKKTKRQCEEVFKKFMKKAIFAPKAYREAGKADSFRGIYMPYWLYDMSQRGNINIPTSTSHRSGDYIITDHYMMRGTLDNYYNGVSYDSSSSFADDISSDIAPFNVKEITSFSPSFLAGYYADIADVPSETYKDTAIELARESTYNYLRKSSPMAGHSFDRPKENIKSDFITNVNVTRSAMFPVWFMSYRTRDRVAYATVNGQSGKVSADIPMSIPKYLLCALLISAVLFGVFQLAFTIMPDLLLLLVSIVALISVLTYGSEMKKIVAKENFDDDLGMQYKDDVVEQKKRARLQAQKGASFGDENSGHTETYVLTQNDINRAKREKARKKKADKKSASLLSIIIVCVVFFIVGGAVFEGVLSSAIQSGGIIKIGAFMSLIFLVITIISVINAKKNISQMASKNGLPESIGSAISLFVIFIVCIWDPAKDMIYYVAAIIAMLGVAANIFGIIRSYNLLATRPLPQFKRYQGGDDRA